jgi:beta-glucosidase
MPTDPQWAVNVSVTNTGKVDGAEVVQLVGCAVPFAHRATADGQYVSFPEDEVEQPPKHLKGYEKVHLLAGQTKTATFHLVRVF